ncbi:hypothetical protein ZWY2020_054994 [Hordeum vulgare]|nr:hypothetical protein ZWY2020_054994 [Hordeum vulgare]
MRPTPTRPDPDATRVRSVRPRRRGRCRTSVQPRATSPAAARLDHPAGREAPRRRRTAASCPSTAAPRCGPASSISTTAPLDLDQAAGLVAGTVNKDTEDSSVKEVLFQKPLDLIASGQNLLLTETWKLADGGNSLRTYVCIKEAIEAPVLMIAHGNFPGEKSLIAVSSKRLYGEGYNDRIANVTLIIQQLVHGSVPGEPPLEEHLIEASAEHFLGKGHDDSNYKRIPGVTPNNSKQLGEPPLEEPLIQANTGCDDSGKRIPDVTLVGKQLGDSSGVAPSWGKIDSLATMNTEKWSEAIEVRLIHAGTRCR